jgi:hypothetical protein
MTKKVSFLFRNKCVEASSAISEHTSHYTPMTLKIQNSILANFMEDVVFFQACLTPTKSSNFFSSR